MNIKKKNPLNSNSYKDINNNQLQNEDYDYNNEDDNIDINNLGDDENKNKSKDRLRGKNREKIKPYEEQSIKCILCKNDVPFNDNNSLIHCNKCQGSLCDKCAKPHLKENPSHKLNNLNTYIINNNLFDIPS